MSEHISRSEDKLGISGRLAARFLQTEITPLLMVVGLLLGFFAIAVTPREEEPQIDVTFANVFIPYPGASASEVEQLVSTPMERILSEIDGVEHIYSVSRPGDSILTVQFEVGEPRDEAIVRLYNAVYSNRDWMPSGIGVLPALIKPRGIDDVPIVTGTLWSEDPEVGAHELRRVAHVMETELQRVPGTRDIYTIGGPDRVVSVRLDPDRLAGYDIDLQQLRQALSSANASADAGSFAADNEDILVQAGTFLGEPDEVADLVVGAREGRPVFLRDVATVSLGPDLPQQRASFGLGPESHLGLPSGTQHPAVTMAVAKKPGTNAVDVADAGAGPGRDARDHHAELWQNGGRQGEDADQEAGVRHAVGNRPGRAGPGPARGRCRGRRGGDHAGDYAVRVLGLGVHVEPRVAVRADFFHRHPGGRRHCRG
jgi:multidrug efflux pump subunit AcrB